MADWTLPTVLFIAIAAVIAIVWYVRRRATPEQQLKKLLSSVGNDYLRNFVVPNGVGGEIHIDCLVLTPIGLIVLDIIDAQGTVFAGDRLDTWSATDNGQRITFINPIPRLQARIEAISSLARGVPLDGRVLFVGNVEFPKGHPRQVATPTSLLEELADIDVNGNAQHLEHHWENIQRAITT